MRRGAAQSAFSTRLGQQRGLERAANRLLSFAPFSGGAHPDNRLSWARQPLEAAGTGAPAPIVEPVAQFCVRQEPGDAGPARGAAVERPGGEWAETEAIGGTSRDHDTVERCQQGRIGSYIGAETKYDALGLAGGRH